MWIYIQQIFLKKTFLQYLIENNIDLNKINEKQNLFSSGYVHFGYIYLNTQSYNASSNLIANKNKKDLKNIYLNTQAYDKNITSSNLIANQNIIINENKNWIVNSSKIIDFKSINKIWKIIM